MSVAALTWSFSLRLQNMACKAVLHALADHASGEGVCWPSVERVALFAGCNVKTARKALQKVVELGIVRREIRPGKSDVFTLDFGWTPPKNDPSLKRHPSQKRPLPKTPLTPPKNAPDPSQDRGSNLQNHQEPLMTSATADAGEPALDITKALFDSGVKILTRSGVSQGQARGLIGKWRKSHGDETVLAALGRCQNASPSEPVAWMTAALRTAAPGKHQREIMQI